MIKLVVFDWNGTLVADTLACLSADNHVLKTFNGKQVDLKTFRDTIIIPTIDFYVQHGCNRTELVNNSTKLGEVFHKYYEQRALKVRTRKKVRQLLEWLYKHHIQSVILSNHTVEGINNQLGRLGLTKYFIKVLANIELDSSMKRRSKKQKLEDFLKRGSFKKNEAIIIGDSPEEVETGKYIGMMTVSITNGHYSKERLIKSNPDYIIGNLHQLIKIIKCHFGTERVG